MKTISESILENNLYDILKDHLLYHIKISEYILNPFVYESLGTFNQAGKVAEYIFDNIRKNGFKDKIIYNCKKFKTYFDDIELVCHNSNEIYGNYNGQENRKIYIELYIPKKITYDNYDDFMFIFIHELMHGYEDKRRIKHGKLSIFNLLDDNYIKAYRNLRSSNIIRSNIAKIKYFMNDQEMNAYFGTLDNIIQQLIKKNNITKDNIEYNKLINDIKDSYLFKEYFNLCKFIISLDNINNEDKQDIVELYKYYYKQNLSYNQIQKEINNKWNIFYNKFNQLVPKIICKYIIDDSKHKTYDFVRL